MEGVHNNSQNQSGFNPEQTDIQQSQSEQELARSTVWGNRFRKIIFFFSRM